MKESVTYQGILEEGELKATHLRIGRKKLGTPDQSVEMAVRSIIDTARLGRMSDQLLDVKSWQDLLAIE